MKVNVPVLLSFRTPDITTDPVVLSELVKKWLQDTSFDFIVSVNLLTAQRQGYKIKKVVSGSSVRSMVPAFLRHQECKVLNCSGDLSESDRRDPAVMMIVLELIRNPGDQGDGFV